MAVKVVYGAPSFSHHQDGQIRPRRKPELCISQETPDLLIPDENNALEFLRICYSLILCFSKVTVTKHYSAFYKITSRVRSCGSPSIMWVHHLWMNSFYRKIWRRLWRQKVENNSKPFHNELRSHTTSVQKRICLKANISLLI